MKTKTTLLSFLFLFFLSKNITTQRNYIPSNFFLKSFYLLIFTFIISLGTQAQIYSGDLSLYSQLEVDAFNYTEVTGNLRISGSDIGDLTPLSSLTSVEGILLIENTVLTSLTGLENITSVGKSLIISGNPALTSLAGLENMTSVGESLSIGSNPALTSLAGLKNITSVKSLSIGSNTVLTSLTGLENITSLDENLYISNNSALTSLTGLENITSVGVIFIDYNPALTSLTGLENITSVENYLSISGNTVLTTLAGLENITSVGGDFTISYNPLLSSFCALYDLINGDGITGTYSVVNNVVNPTQQEIKDSGSCILSVFIPDANFEQALIDLGIDSDGIINQQILKSDVKAVTLLDVSNPTTNPNLPNVNAEITDLTGIEAFINLDRLYCLDNSLSELNISQNLLLTTLYTNNNQLSNLNVTNNPLLTTIRCEENLLSSIDVSQNTALLYLMCYNNQITELDLQYNTALQYLLCNNNLITELDLSYHSNLTILKCDSNQLTNLDVRNGNNANFTLFDAISNNLTCINVDDETADHIIDCVVDPSGICQPGPWKVDEGVSLSNDCSYNTQIGNEVSINLYQGFVQYENVIQSGNTTLKTGVVGPEIPEGFAFGNPAIYFDIETTASFTGAIEVAIYFGDMAYIQDSDLRIMHYETDDWVDVTTSVDLASKMIYGEVYSLSPFVVVEYVNTPPIIDHMIAPIDPIALGNVATVMVEFNDDNLNEGLIDWGDGNGFVAGDITGQTIVYNYSYPSPGVYAVTVKLVDMADEVIEQTYRYIVVYDPFGGFVTGGGWINSPPGAYTANPLLEGKANFGFTAKYKKGSTVPTGNTEFQFKAGDLNFNSSLFDWLVIAGSKAKFKGEGTINGIGSYGFMISAIDEDSKDKTDKFRIKIWDMTNEEFIVYDNQIGEEEDSDPTTEIAGGAIVVHSGTKAKSDQDKTVLDDSILIYPNPVSNTLNIESALLLTKVEIYSILGEKVKEINTNLKSIYLGDLANGIYMINIYSEKGTTVRKLIKQ